MSRHALVGLMAFLAAMAAQPAWSEELLPEATLADTGLHEQGWFLQSFLDVGEDLAEAQANGKGLVVIFEQAGCPYCREMHEVNLRQPAIVAQIRETFDVLQLDLRGSREVTDADGEALTERELARKWGVVFTPTLIFLARDADTAGKPANQAAAAVMPGYFKPFHFASMFDYVASDAYRDQHFQEFIVARAEKLRGEGVDVKIWD